MDDTTQAVPRQRRRLAAVLAIVTAFGALAWVWYDARDRIGATQEELARRLRSIETESREARLLARQAQEADRLAIQERSGTGLERGGA